MGKLSDLINDLNSSKINYFIIRKYNELPEKIQGDVDIAVSETDLKKLLKIVETSGFQFYPHTEPHWFYFSADETGLIKLDIIKLKKFPELKKFKNFRVPKSGGIRIKKSLAQKIKTNLKRKFTYFLRGKLICFIGPDGSGKSTLSGNTITALKEFPIKKKFIYFGTKSKIPRTFDLIIKIFRLYIYNLLGKMTITDRYIYLTFRNKPFLNKLIRFISPNPDLIFLASASPENIRKRKKELTLKQIEEHYNYYKKIKGTIPISTESKISDSRSTVLNKILELYR